MNNFRDHKKYSRFRFAREPLTSIDQNEETHRPDFEFARELLARRYPIRALRYWWLDLAIHEEAKRLAEPPVIADVGCDTGIIKRFVRPVTGAKWVGLDLITDRKGIELAKYDELKQCDFDKPLPLPDAAFDIVICSHVLEHLPRPAFTVGELNRVLKPGGMLLLAVPIAPRLAARVRERQFAKQLRSGKRVPGQHIHMFWPRRFREMAEKAGFTIEFASGSSVLKKQGSRLEDHAFWIRLNQIGSAIFPSLGREFCMQLRKPK